MPAPQTSPRLETRPARQSDAGALREILNEAIQDALATFETEPVGLEELRSKIGAAAQDPRRPVLVGELRGWVLGWITLQPCDMRPQMAEIGEVRVFVRRDFRSYGVGRQLMRLIQREAARLGYRKLVGYVLADHNSSLQLCRSCGWREVGRLLEHARHGERLRDVVLVEYLNPAPNAS